jgi:HK97 family phage major capsid protein
MKSMKELRAEIRGLIEQQEQALKAGVMDADDDAAYEERQGRIDALAAELAQAKASDKTAERREALQRLRSPGRITRPSQPSTFPGNRGRGGYREATGPEFRSVDGTIVRAYLPGESVYAPGITDDDFGDCPVGNAIADALTGQPMAMANYGSYDVQGGYLLSPTLSNRVIDLARAHSVVMKAGALTLPMDTSEMALARVTGDPTAAWRAEGVTIPASSMTFGKLTLRAKTLAAIVPVTVEWLEDAANAGSLIESTLAQVLSSELDRVALVGLGSASEPLGIVNTSGVNTTTAVGTPDDYNEVSEAVGSILSDNYAGDLGNLSWISNPRDAGTFDRLYDNVSGVPLTPTPWVQQLQRHYTSKLPITGGAGTEGTMVVGDFSEMLIGVRSQVRIEILPAGTATESDGTSHNAASELKRFIRAYLRADIAVMRPQFFNVLSGVTAS